jgi:hypothetical protein
MHNRDRAFAPDPALIGTLHFFVTDPPFPHKRKVVICPQKHEAESVKIQSVKLAAPGEPVPAHSGAVNDRQTYISASKADQAMMREVATLAVTRACVTRELPPAAAFVFSIIIMHLNRESGRAWPSHPTIANYTGLGANAVAKAIGSLKTGGFIHVQAAQAPHGGRAASHDVV